MFLSQLAGFLLCGTLGFVGFSAERPRFSELASLPPTTKKLEALESHFAQSSAFVRGEIDQEKTLDGLLKYADFAIENQQRLVGQKKYIEAQGSLSKWFQMAADLAYEESTLKGLSTSAQIRALFLTKIEQWADVKTDAIWIASLRQWLVRASAPWPVDRVIVSEGKKIANPVLFPTIDTAARLLQKNPYQSLEKALKGKPGADSSKIVELRKVWEEKDVTAMREELTRLSRLKLKLAAVEYEQKQGKAPLSGQDLVRAGLLPALPIDYQTGRSMDLGKQN